MDYVSQKYEVRESRATDSLFCIYIYYIFSHFASPRGEHLWPLLNALEAAIARQDASASLSLLAQLVPEWQRGEHVGLAQGAHQLVGG